MIDLIKKTLLTGLGATVTTKEKVESLLHDFVEKGKITSQEAQQMADRIVEDSKKEFETAKNDFQEQAEDLVRRANVVTQKQFRELEDRVKKLEDELRQPSNQARPETEASAGPTEG